MAGKKTFYVTTPIYYPNDVPHIGHAYTTIAADVLARWHRLLGEEVFFLTGTDEHGKKIERAAELARKSPQTFVDHLVPAFKEAWQTLGITHDRFIRTTDSDHVQVVQTILAQVKKNGDIYEGYYEGFYCSGCEAYYTEKDLLDGCCPIHGTKIEKLKEESYFFKLSKYQKKLLDYYKKHPDFILPASRRQEIINRVQEGLQDLSISRASFNWGIPLPFDKDHICYVWFDALANYLSGIGYLEHSKEFKKFWPAQVHLIGKDILWFHAVIWPAILLSLGRALPEQIFAHGWWTKDGEKISKSKKNFITVGELTSIAGVDSARYFLFRETPFGEDGDFSAKMLIERHNHELANKLGNLVSRVSTLTEQYGLQEAKPLESAKLVTAVRKHLEVFALDKALQEIFGFIDRCNEYIQEKKPWETHDTKVLWQLCNALKDVAILLSPFMPSTSERIAKVFHFELTLDALKKPLVMSKIKKAPILFTKIDMKPSSSQTPQAAASKPSSGAHFKQSSNRVSYDSFSKLDLRVGKILDVKDHPNADKLYVLTVDLGEGAHRTIVAGLRNHYSKEQLKGKKAVFVANLEPATIRGIESKGMILAAGSDDRSKLLFIAPEQDIAAGSTIR